MAVAFLPAERRQARRLGLVAAEVGEGETLVIAGDAEEQEVFVLPGRQMVLAPAAGTRLRNTWRSTVR